MDNQEKKIPIWCALLYIGVVAVVMIVGDAVLLHHPTAGHILLTIGGMILLATLIGVSAYTFHEKRKRREQEEQEENQKQESHHGH